jgi:hypothetical protein
VSTRWIRLAGATIVASSVLSTAVLAQENLVTCSDVHAYCMRLCSNARIQPPAGWTCEANRCFGLQECLTTGHYKIGTQYGHPKSARDSYGPYEKK